MVHLLDRVTFEDFEKWKSGFDQSTSLRKAYGSQGVRVFRVADKHNQVVILGEYEDTERARQLFQSQEFREATQRAGVVGQPEVTFLEHVEDLPS